MLRGWIVERVRELGGAPAMAVLVGAIAEALITPGGVGVRIGAGCSASGSAGCTCGPDCAHRCVHGSRSRSVRCCSRPSSSYSARMQIRRAKPSDAAAIVKHVQGIVAEPVRTAPLFPDEVVDVSTERDLIEQYANSPRAIMLVAEDDGQIVGDLTLRAISPRRALEHVASLGMSVRASHRRRGIGKALLEEGIAWAKGVGITRLELYVFADNTPAIALYQAMGFRTRAGASTSCGSARPTSTTS